MKWKHWLITLQLGVTLCLPAAHSGLDNDQALVGWWRLEKNAEDSSPKANHGINQGVEFTDTQSAAFDGQGAHIEVPIHSSLELGRDDFTVSVWIRTDEKLDDLIGDLLSKYDPQTRKGFNLGVLNNAGVGSGQSNYRNLFFGSDEGQETLEWVDRGRPGKAVYIMALSVFEGGIYAGTYESGKDQRGHVYRYDGGQEWIDCGSPDPANAISALAEYNGALYAAASHYRAGGSSLEASENNIPGGRVYRYQGGQNWELCGEFEGHEAILGLVTYQGNLYASSLYKPAGLYQYQGGKDWIDCGSPESRCVVLGVWNEQLLSGGYDGDIDKGGVARYEGEKNWTYLGTPPGVTQTYSFASYFGRLYVGTWPEGKVFRYKGPSSWTDVGQLGEEKEVMGMMVYNGKLYGGTLPLAKVFRFDGEGNWTDTGQLDKTPDVKYRRTWTMAIFDGKLFCGTLPSGHVYSLEVGQCVSQDRSLPPGWQHVAVVRAGNRLTLNLNGKEVSESQASRSTPPDLTNGAPLKIGFGPQDSFNGNLRDLRVYRRALSAPEILSLAAPPN